MKKVQYSIVIILSCFCFIISCKKEDTATPKKAEIQAGTLVGTWSQDSSKAGITATGITGYFRDTITVNSNWTDKEYSDGKLTAENIDNWQTSNDSVIVTAQGNSIIRYQYTITGNVLMLYLQPVKYWYHKI